MNKNLFNELVRPHVPEVRIGVQGVGFDRLDLDAWFEDYKSRSTRRPGEQEGGNKPWRKARPAVSRKGTGGGTLTRSSEAEEFAKLVEQLTSKKQRDF